MDKFVNSQFTDLFDELQSLHFINTTKHLLEK